MKEMKKQNENKMVFKDFDWPKLLRENLLKKQRVSILDLYINHHNLSRETNLRKKNKLDLVTAHIQMSLALTNVHVSNIQAMDTLAALNLRAVQIQESEKILY